MLELTLLDLLIIGAYLIGMLLVGVYFVKRIKNPGDYYVAGRTLGPVVLTATVCATIIGGSAMMGRAGLAFTDGFKCVMTAVSLSNWYVHLFRSGRTNSKGRSYLWNYFHSRTFLSALRKILQVHPGSHGRLDNDGNCGSTGDCHGYDHPPSGRSGGNFL